MAAYVPDSINSQAAGTFSFLFGATFLVIVAVMVIGRIKLWRVGKRTTGTVTAVDAETSRTSKGIRTYYHPVVTFKTEDGADHTWRRSVGENRPGYAVGQQVPIIYFAPNPQIATIGTFAETFGVSIFFGALGLLFAGLGWATGPHDLAGLAAVFSYVFGGLLGLKR